MAELLIEHHLARFLQAETSRVMTWGEWDCGLRIANWLAERLGIPDPAAHLRGRYHDQASCEAMIGSPYPLVIARLIRSTGLKRTVEPKAGDPAIIRQPGGAPIAAIRTAHGWTIPAAKGLIRVPADARLMMAWGVDDARRD